MIKPASSLLRWRHGVIGLLGLSLGLLSGCVLPQTRAPEEPIYASAEDRAETQTEVLKQVWKLVGKRFYAEEYNGAEWETAYARFEERAGEAIGTTKFYEVINEMLEELDDAHSGALTPLKSWEERMAARAFVGLSLIHI